MNGSTFASRIAGGLVAALSLALLCVAASLHPDPRGVETHTQLGLWPCGWYLATGSPCPTCGMTTAFSAAATGHPWLAIKTQPFGFAVSLVTAIAFWAGLHQALFGSRFGSVGGGLFRPKAVMLAAAFFAASWVYKIATMPAAQ